MPAQEEVAAQPAVEVLDDRTGADDVLGHRVHGFLEIIEAVAESLPQRRLLLPTLRLAWVQRLEFEQCADDRQGHLEFSGQVDQIALELGGESQELIAVVAQQGAHRTEAMRAERLP